MRRFLTKTFVIAAHRFVSWAIQLRPAVDVPQEAPRLATLVNVFLDREKRLLWKYHGHGPFQSFVEYQQFKHWASTLKLKVVGDIENPSVLEVMNNG